MSNSRLPTRLLLGIAAIAVLCLVVLGYSRGFPGSFLFDDAGALEQNAQLRIDGAVFDEWRTAAYSTRTGPLQRPLAMLSFAADHVIFGELTPKRIRSSNIVIHLLCGLLVYLLSLELLCLQAKTRLAPNRLHGAALLAASLWLLHPLQVSTVLYSVQRMAQFATFFTLLGLWVFVRYRRAWMVRAASPGEVLAAGLWLLLISMAAVLSKENGLLLLWLIPVIEVSLVRGVWAGAGNRRVLALGWILMLLPVMFVTAVLLLRPELVLGGFQGREFGAIERVLTQSRLLWEYLAWIFLPDLRSMGFQHDDIALSSDLFHPFTTALSVLAWPAVLVLAWLWRRTCPLLFFALLFYLVAHSMESSVWPLEMVYEHRNYLPSVAACLLFASLVLSPPALRNNRISTLVATGAVLALFALLSLRAHTWSDDLTLSRVNSEHHPASSRSHYFYARALLDQHEQREVLGLDEETSSEVLLASRYHFERMYQQNPRDVAALVLLYHLDSAYFPDMIEVVDWLPKLELLLRDRKLQASDRGALISLVKCFSARICPAEEARILRIFENLANRYPGSSEFLRLEYAYLAGTDANPARRQFLLERAVALNPADFVAYHHQIREYALTGDVAGMYEAARRWFENDPKRHSLPVIKSLFSEGENSQ